MKRKSQEERFWDRVSKKPFTERGIEKNCWEWTGKLTSTGYARVPFAWEGRRAARYSYHLNIDKNFNRNLFVCHTCDNPLCVKPEHLFLDTCQGNVTDKTRKARQARGTTHGLSVLTEDNVRFIREFPKQYGYQTKLAKMFNVTQQTISEIVHGKIWKHI